MGGIILEKGFRDEIILKKREDLKKSKYMSLESGCYIRGKILKFLPTNMFDTFSIYLPDTMRIMPEELARIKYPSEFRPDKIYTTLDLSINIGFSILWNKLQTKDVKKVAERMISAIQRSNSDYQFYELVDIKKISGCYFSFRSHAIDVDIYNAILIFVVNNELIQSSFNCLYQQSDDWKKIIRLMWESIEKIKD